ncbi:hydroxyacylglutathione hydrolase [Sphaceloma murrayae]|uniref:Hydroxyacylglutathione hydrolase n=1 Tax=Sphaceloma murrayae TaxID=2082308 RepID=A0A2K1QHD8_9PEZI|nr:hydroxyacylglutathione hydrolase [Sphaceloma murrayae]
MTSPEPVVRSVFESVTGTWQHIVTDPVTKSTAIIDPVIDYDPAKNEITTSSADRLLDIVTDQQLLVSWILETHAHADHLTAAHYLRGTLATSQAHRPSIAIGHGISGVQRRWAERYGIPKHEYEGAFDHTFHDGETFQIGELTVRVLHLPGHTPDHIGYLIGSNVFTGDSIFNPDVGSARTDFPEGSATQLWSSMKKLLALPDHYKLYTGHDYPPEGRQVESGQGKEMPYSTVKEQKESNKHVKNGTQQDDFVAWRQQRDSSLAQPRLINQALQWNIRADLQDLTPSAFMLTPPTSTTSENSAFIAAPSDERRHVHLYYHHFHAHHPFLLPEAFANVQPWPEYLRQIVASIGARYCSRNHDLDFRATMGPRLDACQDQTLEMVQARLLSAILLHAQAQPQCALYQLDKAIDVALRLGLHTEAFSNTQPCTLTAESARRTWWELYAVDCLLAAFHHKPTFRTATISTTTHLPSDEPSYLAGLPNRSTLAANHLRHRLLLDTPFSPYALRIEALTLLARVLSANDPSPSKHEDALLSLDALLSSWHSSLPHPTSDRASAPLLFSAHTIVNMASIYLHLPRCSHSLSSREDIACAKANHRLAPFLDAASSSQSHASRALAAAKRISAHATSSSTDTDAESNQSPFFVCALVLMAVTFLSAMVGPSGGGASGEEWMVDRVAQAVGMLGAEAPRWGLWEKVRGQVRRVGRVVVGFGEGEGNGDGPRGEDELSEGQSQGQGMDLDSAGAAIDFDKILAEMWWGDNCCLLPGLDDVREQGAALA